MLWSRLIILLEYVEDDPELPNKDAPGFGVHAPREQHSLAFSNLISTASITGSQTISWRSFLALRISCAEW